MGSRFVKFRLGWDSLTAPEFARTVVRAGADRVTLHCRTRAQMYMPSADPDAAAAVCDGLKEEIADGRLHFDGNGDVDSPEAAERYLACGCTGVAVGRAALGCPWIFRRLKDPAGFVPPGREEIKATVLRLTEDVVREKGEVRGVREARGRAAQFIRGMRGSAALRDALNRAETLAEFARLLEAF